ncbi:MAG: aminotransferase class V-fold PLP-dependent enzyme [Chlorobiales bacterium]|nr:aminotransferase class V-fold PLP-dependent enzyme [Chlorobiales bacterium]
MPQTHLSKAEVLEKTEAYRQYFLHTKRQIYLNHAAVSPLSTRVVAAITSHLHERSETDIENFFPTLLPTLKSARGRVASFIGCEPKNIAFVQNTSYGLNLLAQGLKWRKGDRIILYEKEFPANVYPFLNLEKRGVKIDFVKDRNGEIYLDDIEALITPRTRLVSLSFVQFLTGYRLDLKALATLCHRHGVLCSIDAIQGLGALPIDCKDSGIDFLASGGHKWAMSPMGTGFIYVSDALLERLDPVMVGWTSVDDAWNMLDYRLELLPDARRYELGMQNWIGIAGLNEAFGIFNEIGTDVLAEKILLLSDFLVEELVTKGFEPVLTCSREHRSGIMSIKNLPDVEHITKELANRNIEVSFRAGLLRIAPHFYNTCSELEALISELKQIVHR